MVRLIDNLRGYGLALLVGLAGLLPVVPASAAAACADEPARSDQLREVLPQEDRPQVALMGTIPIYWGETDGFYDLLAGGATPHWARGALERCYDLQPLDYLSAEALAPHSLLLLAQPRGFSPEENVALDAWVRAGGRLLLFADPLMTGESRFGIGDRRRPQDTILLSPVLAHWGLDLRFDDEQSPGAQMREIAGIAVPVAMAGQFSLVGEGADCTLSAAGIAAQCQLGDGFALILADAALLDLYHMPLGAYEALVKLAAQAFGESGDCAGSAAGKSFPSQKEIDNQDDKRDMSAVARAPVDR